MAMRPVFVISDSYMLVDSYMIEFKWHHGLALCQRQKCVESLHHSFVQKRPDLKVLEVSSKSKISLGVKLSAFNLMIKDNVRDKSYSVEIFYHASKIFENGGPYLDILDATSFKAKRDTRLKSSGNVIGFMLDGEMLKGYPDDFFYTWVYVNALAKYPELVEQIIKYDAFTDIVFNPVKSYICQAKACAIFVSLFKKSLLDEALKNKEQFLRIVYPEFDAVNQVSTE